MWVPYKLSCQNVILTWKPFKGPWEGIRLLKQPSPSLVVITHTLHTHRQTDRQTLCAMVGACYGSSTGEDQAGNHPHSRGSVADGHSHWFVAAHSAETDTQRQTTTARHCLCLLIKLLRCVSNWRNVLTDQPITLWLNKKLYCMMWVHVIAYLFSIISC